MMKSRLMLMLFLLAAAMVPVREANATPCASLLCMWGMASGGSGGGACAVGIAEFHAIQVWDGPYFDASSTANSRRTFLQSCPGSMVNAAQLEMIIGMFGYEP